MLPVLIAAQIMPMWTALEAQQVFDPLAGKFDLIYASHESDLEYTIGQVGLKAGDNVLDLGCATGSLALRAKSIVGSGGRVVGMDISSRLLEVARNKARALGQDDIEFVEGDITSWQKLQHLHHESSPRFDVIFCTWVLAHVPPADRIPAISQWLQLLAPTGRLVIELGYTDVAAVETMKFSDAYLSLLEPRRPLEAGDYEAGSKWALATTESWNAGKTAFRKLADEAKLEPLHIWRTFSASNEGGYIMDLVEVIQAQASARWAQQGNLSQVPQDFVEAEKEMFTNRAKENLAPRKLQVSIKNVSWTGTFQGRG